MTHNPAAHRPAASRKPAAAKQPATVKPPILKKLTYIDRHRMFTKWDGSASDHMFGSETIIYGHNGAGKTTLGEIFAKLASAQRAGERAPIKVTATFAGPIGPKAFDTTTSRGAEATPTAS